MRSPEYKWWLENERDRMARSQRWRPSIGTIAAVVFGGTVALAVAEVAFVIWTVCTKI